MFFARPEPLELSAQALQALRLSVNSPVISTAELQVGPARAALAVHLEADGCPNVTVAIRSLRTDESVHYSFEGDLGSESSVAVALDAGLSFAETMGFLFGEDELAAGDEDARERALERWGEVAWGAVPPAETAPPGQAPPVQADPPPGTEREFLLDELANSLSEALGSDSPEIMLELDEEVPAELEIDPVPAAGPPAAAPEPAAAPPPKPAPPASVPTPALTKFRTPAPAAAPASPRPAAPAPPAQEEAADRNETTQHALGRLKLVKRRRGRGAGATEKPNPILRLLSSF